MPAPVLADRLRAGETLFTAWNAWPEPLLAEAEARAGFNCVTLDMQHGMHDAASVMRGVAALARIGAAAIVRIPVGDNAFANRALDMGAAAVIAPMINAVADARAFAAATKFPPVGARSWGPFRAMALHGADGNQAYLDTANATTLALAMIETNAALDALDDILAVDGIDGVFAGPSDMSVSLSDGARIDPRDRALDAPLKRMADRAAVAGKLAAGFAVDAELARRLMDFGYRLIGVGNDDRYLTGGVQALLAAVKRRG